MKNCDRDVPNPMEILSTSSPKGTDNGLEVNAPSASRAVIINSQVLRQGNGADGGTGWFKVLGKSKYDSEDKELPKATELREQGRWRSRGR